MQSRLLDVIHQGRSALILTGMLLMVATADRNASAQSTYTWNVNGTGAWVTASNWTPPRNAPASSDIIRIDGASTPSVTIHSVVNQPIGKLVVANGATVRLQVLPPNPATLTIAGGTGVDLDVPSGSLILQGNPALTISLTGAATGSVAGNVTVSGAAHRLVATAVGSFEFVAGSVVSTATGFTGNLFTGSPNGVLFQDGSTYVSGAGSDPFTYSPPSSAVVFAPGSLYKHQQVTPPSLVGRTYGDFELNFASHNTINGGNIPWTVDRLIMTAGTFHLRMTDIHIRSEVYVASGATLAFDPTSAQGVFFDGTDAQTINSNGALTFNSFSNVTVSNATGVTLQCPVTLAGTTTVESGAQLAVQAALTNNGTMQVNGAFQIDQGGTTNGTYLLYGAGSTLVFNNASQINYTGQGYWASPSPPPNVTLQNGGGVVLAAPTPHITGTLRLTDSILTGGFPPIIIDPGGAVVGADEDAFVNGKLLKTVPVSASPQQVTFEIGSGSSYAPIQLDFPSVGTSGTILCFTNGGDHVGVGESGIDPARSVNRHWEIQSVGTVFSPCDATFNFLSGDVDGGSDPNTFVVRKFDDPNVWTATVIGARGANYTQATGIASFSEFQIGVPAWPITATAGAGGSISPAGSVIVDEGTDQVFTITPDPGYLIQDVLVDGVSIGAVNAYTFMNVVQSHLIEATFAVVPFEDIVAALPGWDYFGAVAWADYDNDNDLDILLTGDSGGGLLAQLHQNTGGVFSLVASGLPGVWRSAVAWGDYDNDADLDLVLTGNTGAGLISRVYKNNGGALTDIGAGLPGVETGAVAWGDYDNDGDLDLVLAGSTTSSAITRIYRNEGLDTFVDAAAGLPGTYLGSAAWGDSDTDGDLDLLLTGHTGSIDVSVLYVNDAGVLADGNAGLTGLRESSAAWGDCDSDGDLDILIAGSTAGVPASHLYRNDGANQFTLLNAGLVGASYGSAAWGDCDNDGDLDILLTGAGPDSSVSIVYRNDGQGNVTDSDADLPGVKFSSAVWGDYDNDGDLDILFAGYRGFQDAYCRVYRNNAGTANTVPTAPTALTGQLVGGIATLSWTAATDTETPAAGLTYSIRIGTTPGGSEISSAMANAADGFLRVPRIGNANHRLSWSVDVSPATECYWSVQAVDAAFAGSPFAPEATLAPSSFTDIAAGLVGVSVSAVAWGDYDSDGDLDLILTGHDGSAGIARIYRNVNGDFEDIGAGLPGVWAGSVAWGDYDGDSDLDFAMTGLTGSTFLSRIYRNDGGSFVDIAAGLLGTYTSSVAWGDYDNDGDLDLLIAGGGTLPRTSRLYRNNGGSFLAVAAGLMNVDYAAVAWGDYDVDGDLDILLTGYLGGASVSIVYRNDSGVFTDIGAGLQGMFDSAVAWGDYDSDGDLDILMAGAISSAAAASLVYRNDNGSFVDIGAGLVGITGDVAWGDYDNDGDLDILLTGRSPSGPTDLSRIYRNESGTFVDLEGELPGLAASSSAWGDYDNDGDLDLVLSGSLAPGNNITRIYANHTGTPNTLPAAPTGPSALLVGSSATFSWNASSDAQTPLAALTYNLRVGITPGGSEVVAAQADAASGYRRIPAIGNTGHRLSWEIDLPPWANGVSIFWSVQAIDAAFAGSPWSTTAVAAVDDAPPVPTLSLLHAGAPNPFQEMTRFAFDLADPGTVHITVHDVRGRLVRDLRHQLTPAGRHEVTWDGTAEDGQPVVGGTYFVSMAQDGRRQTQRVVRLR